MRGGLPGLQGLHDLPDSAVLRIMEESDYDLRLLLVDRRMRALGEGTGLRGLAMRVVHALAREVSVRRIVALVARGRESPSRRARALRDAILEVARDEMNPVHCALLVCAPVVARLVADGAAELFASMRGGLERAVRTERVGQRHVYAHVDSAVARVGRSAMSSTAELRDALAAYVTDHAAVVDRYGPMCFWDVSAIEDMSGLFHESGARAFSGDLFWATRNVRRMDGMFRACGFNGRIGHWDVRRVTTMEDMFHGATRFNQPLDSWDVSAVRSTARMFCDTPSFDQPLGAWRLDSVESVERMFCGSAQSSSMPRVAARALGVGTSAHGRRMRPEADDETETVDFTFAFVNPATVAFTRSPPF